MRVGGSGVPGEHSGGVLVILRVGSIVGLSRLLCCHSCPPLPFPALLSRLSATIVTPSAVPHACPLDVALLLRWRSPIEVFWVVPRVGCLWACALVPFVALLFSHYIPKVICYYVFEIALDIAFEVI